MVFGASVVTGTALFALMTQTTEELTDDARDTADGAARGLMSSVEVRSVTGLRDPKGPGIDRLLLLLATPPGLEVVPLEALAIQLHAPAGSATFTLRDQPTFAWSAVIDADPPLDGEQPHLRRGDLVEVRLDAKAADLPLPPRARADLVFLLPSTRAVRTSFTVPPVVAGSSALDLHGEPAPQGWSLHRMEPEPRLPLPAWTLHRMEPEP